MQECTHRLLPRVVFNFSAHKGSLLIHVCAYVLLWECVCVEWAVYSNDSRASNCSCLGALETFLVISDEHSGRVCDTRATQIYDELVRLKIHWTSAAMETKAFGDFALIHSHSCSPSTPRQPYFFSHTRARTNTRAETQMKMCTHTHTHTLSTRTNTHTYFGRRTSSNLQTPPLEIKPFSPTPVRRLTPSTGFLLPWQHAAGWPRGMWVKNLFPWRPVETRRNIKWLVCVSACVCVCMCVCVCVCMCVWMRQCVFMRERATISSPCSPPSPVSHHSHQWWNGL